MYLKFVGGKPQDYGIQSARDFEIRKIESSMEIHPRLKLHRDAATWTTDGGKDDDAGVTGVDTWAAMRWRPVPRLL